MKRVAFALFLAAVVSARPDVVIYKLVESQTWTGEGGAFRQTVSSKLVFDPQDPGGTKLFTSFPGKFYQVDCPYFVAKYMNGPGRSKQAAFFMDGHGFDTNDLHQSVMHMFLRGTNSNVLIGPNSRLLIPKILRGSFQGSYRSASGADIVGSGNVVASYLGTETQAANTELKTVADVVAAYRESAESNGWTEVVADAPCE